VTKKVVGVFVRFRAPPERFPASQQQRQARHPNYLPIRERPRQQQLNSANLLFLGKRAHGSGRNQEQEYQTQVEQPLQVGVA
jgi:hypothetical protein